MPYVELYDAAEDMVYQALVDEIMAAHYQAAGVYVVKDHPMAWLPLLPRDDGLRRQALKASCLRGPRP